MFSGLAHPEQSVRHHRRRQQGQHRQQAVEEQHRLCVGQVLLFAHLGISFTRPVQVPQFWQPLFTNHDQQLLKVSYLDFNSKSQSAEKKLVKLQRLTAIQSNSLFGSRIDYSCQRQVPGDKMCDNNNTQSIADYLAQLLKDKKQLAAFPNVFLHLERLLDDGKRLSLFFLDFLK